MDPRDRTLNRFASSEQRPRVAILLPAFNRERFVGEAIRSAVEQDFGDFELIVVDDGSTDGTLEIAREWERRDARIAVIRSERNQGIPAALNLALQRVRAPYIARLDSDDLMMPGQLAAQAAVLDAHPEVAVVSMSYETIDEAGRYLSTSPAAGPHEVVAYFLNFHNPIGVGAMFRRDDVLAIGGFALDYPSSEDYDLWTRLLERGRLWALPAVGLKQRRHGEQSIVKYRSVKRDNWCGIMTRSLRAYLGREVERAEVDALIALWRLDGTTGMAVRADEIMREAFARFCREHPDRGLQRAVRERTAYQWLRGVRELARSGHLAEACQYLRRALDWSPPAVLGAARRLVRR